MGDISGLATLTAVPGTNMLLKSPHIQGEIPFGCIKIHDPPTQIDPTGFLIKSTGPEIADSTGKPSQLVPMRRDTNLCVAYQRLGNTRPTCDWRNVHLIKLVILDHAKSKHVRPINSDAGTGEVF